MTLHNVIPSMSRPGSCFDNARMESFWATLKGELIGDHVFATRGGAVTRDNLDPTAARMQPDGQGLGAAVRQQVPPRDGSPSPPAGRRRCSRA